MGNLTDIGAKIVIEDNKLACSRPRSENQVLFSGDPIEIPKKDKNEDNQFTEYSLTFSKTISLENDASQMCKNYPNEKFQNYKKCDDFFIQQTFYLFGNLNSIWAVNTSGNISGPTYIPYFTDDSFYNLMNIIHGAAPSNCPQPCTTISVASRKTNSFFHKGQYNWIDLLPAPRVLVTKTEFENTSVSSLLAKCGGSMGFWLGIGVIQLLEVLFSFLKVYRYLCNVNSTLIQFFKSM